MRVRALAAVAAMLDLAACASGPRGGTPTGTAGGAAGASGGAGAAGGVAGASGGAGGSAGAAGGAGAGGAGTAGAGGTTDAAASDAPAGGEAGPEVARDVDGGGDGEAGGAHLTLPIERNGLDVLQMGNLSFTVNPAVGARITSVKLDGDELLADASATGSTMFWGSTLWTSPASDWVGGNGVVVVPAVDTQPYTTTVSTDGVITATSASVTYNNKHFSITKVFHADLAKQAIVIDYQLKNLGTTSFSLAHWEVTRVFPGGLVFFPSGTKTNVQGAPDQPLKFTTSGGYTWYDNTTHVMGMGDAHAGSDSTSPTGDFIAEVAPHTTGDMLFIKAFSAITLAQAPPGHSPIEVYCNSARTYVELEDHSAYAPIAAGATYTRTVTWTLRRLPPGTDRSVGSAALIAAVTNALAGR
jgi:hypothetical protein